MKPYRITEFETIERQAIQPAALRRLQRLDERLARTGTGTVLDWSHSRYIKAKSCVGVLQVPGLTVEILPKIDAAAGGIASSGGESRCTDPLCLAQQNLLYMLAYTRRVPVHEREIAGLGTERMSLLEALVHIFTQYLLRELSRGLDSAYVYREEDRPFIRGKLLLAEQLRRNLVHAERFHVGYSDFVSDTWLNRIIKATCRRLLPVTVAARLQQRLREALMHLADVTDCTIGESDFKRVAFNRNNERFRPVIEFCRIVLLGQSPAPRADSRRTFTFLFPMESLFEEFVARFIVRHGEDLGVARSQVHIQAVGKRKWLLQQRQGGASQFGLRPDILIDDPTGKVKVIIDTKWKRLIADPRVHYGVAQADLYQLFAYAMRYRCPDNILLFPAAPGVDLAALDCKIPELSVEHRIRVATINLNRDLKKSKAELITEIKTGLAAQAYSAVPSSNHTASTAAR